MDDQLLGDGGTGETALIEVDHPLEAGARELGLVATPLDAGCFQDIERCGPVNAEGGSDHTDRVTGLIRLDEGRGFGRCQAALRLQLAWWGSDAEG